jgi:ankyrin repeat protein
MTHAAPTRLTRSISLGVLLLGLCAGVGRGWAGSYEDFFSAIRRDDHRSVSALLHRGVDANTLDETGRHGLFLALQAPSPQVATILINWPKTEVETRNAEDESPLMIAALTGQFDVAVRLIERGAHVNKPGWAPLHYAATKGHLNLIQLLLEHHAYIDAASPNGTTPLMMAAHYGSDEAVRLLLDEGADPTLRNQLKLSAIDFAEQAQRPETVEIIAAAIRASQRHW